MAIPPNPISDFDSSQVLKYAFDEATGRLRVDAQVTANIAGVQEVVIDHASDSIKVGDGTDFMAVNTDGSINNVTKNMLVTVPFDAITVELTSDTVETYKYRTGGAAGSIAATVTVTYTDDTKETISSVVRT